MRGMYLSEPIAIESDRTTRRCPSQTASGIAQRETDGVDEATRRVEKSDRVTAFKPTEIKKDDKTEAKPVELPKFKFDIRIPTNAELAGNLEVLLMLVHGETHNNVHSPNTMRLIDALIKAHKRYEHRIISGARHSVAWPIRTSPEPKQCRQRIGATAEREWVPSGPREKLDPLLWLRRLAALDPGRLTRR